MRLADVERALATVPPHPAPRPDLEQYVTPPDLAARWLFELRAKGDVEGRRVVDLGCGTGSLALAAALWGARDVVGVDVDPAAVAAAREAASRLGVAATFEVADVRDWTGVADLVVMNPPFGSQTRHADRPFLTRAFATAPVVASLHHAATRAWVERFAAEHAYAVTDRWRLVFPLPHQYRFHGKPVREVETVALRMARDPPGGPAEAAL